ncbi:hypothetical protein LSAT2_006450 [Lamellibrachia satsuma]|nr:hypothetical protein LSAT2_006450 [Lamellibrachia satsuma]
MAEQQKTQKHSTKPVSASPIVGCRSSPREALERHKASSAVSGRQMNGYQGAALSIVEPLPFNATVEPLLVHVGSQSRPPTLQESQVIIKHLQRVGDKQAHELSQLKTDLRDVLYSHKWSPDAYLLAKAYVAEDEEREAAEYSRLPKIALRQPSRKLPEMAYMPRDMISLPALKQTMGNKAVERRKRTQILQKARLRREVLQ